MKLSRRVAITRFSLFVLATSPSAALAARPCVDNFTEKGDTFAGKTVSTFVDAKGTTDDKAFVAIGRELAKLGYLGVTVNKDLGLVSGYYEYNGKKSPLNVTVTETNPGTLRIEAAYTPAAGLRFPTAGVRDELCSVLESTLPPTERTAAAPAATTPDARFSSSGVGLRSKDGDIELVARRGDVGATDAYFATLIFLNYPGVTATIRVADRRPAIFVRLDRTEDDPKSTMTFLVKLDPSKGADQRSLKVGRSTLRGSGGYSSPDPDWTVSADVQQDSPGLWRVTPKADLKPGEYGLFIGGAGLLFDFGVDK